MNQGETSQALHAIMDTFAPVGCDRMTAKRAEALSKTKDALGYQTLKCVDEDKVAKQQFLRAFTFAVFPNI